MREVNVRWLRILMPVVAVGLFVAVLVYQDQERDHNEAFEPFDHRALRERIWFDDAVTPPEWVGQLNYLAAAGYVLVGLGLGGRVRWRAIVVMFCAVAAAATAALAGLAYLTVTDYDSFPLGAPGMQAIYLFHVVGGAALGAAWLQLRRAALRGEG